MDRRELLAGGVGAVAGGGALAGTGEQSGSVFLPEDVWRERMTAPDDGKKYGWVVDSRRCFGCHGCEVACKAENDVPLGDYIRQTIYHDHTRESGAVARIMIPMACQHCEDAPVHGFRYGEGGGQLLEITGVGASAAKMFTAVNDEIPPGPPDIPKVLAVLARNGVTVEK